MSNIEDSKLLERALVQVGRVDGTQKVFQQRDQHIVKMLDMLLTSGVAVDLEFDEGKGILTLPYRFAEEPKVLHEAFYDEYTLHSFYGDLLAFCTNRSYYVDMLAQAEGLKPYGWELKNTLSPLLQDNERARLVGQIVIQKSGACAVSTFTPNSNGYSAFLKRVEHIESCQKMEFLEEIVHEFCKDQQITFEFYSNKCKIYSDAVTNTNRSGSYLDMSCPYTRQGVASAINDLVPFLVALSPEDNKSIAIEQLLNDKLQKTNERL